MITINSSAQIFCYLKANDPGKIRVKPKREDFRYNFFGQDASHAQITAVANSRPINQSILQMQTKLQTLEGGYDSEINKILSLARKEVSTFINSIEGQSLKQKTMNYDAQIIQDLYP